jgi:thioesterase domain-containing protein
LKLKAHLQDALEIQIPLTIFFSQPVIRDLCQALENLAEKREYDPVTVLQPNGTKTPLFFIHPGVGEVLIFMNLARHIDDRPVYALRARGFDGEEYFSSMQEMITTYYQAIKRVQPDGPYAIAGYSFGSILAFEITKIIEAHGDKVQFLASFDQPPHFKQRARTYDWYEVVLTISFFMGLISEDYAYKSLPEMRQKTHDEVLDHVLGLADPARLEEVGMTRARLDNWAKLAYQLKVVAWDYDPAGVVANTDVFYTGPLLGIVKARNMKEWFDDYISRWKDFAKDVKFHEVSGTHRTMITPPNVIGFQKLLKAAMEQRGL